MSPLCTGRHVDQWESSDMSEQSRGGCAKSLRVFPLRSRRPLRFALSEERRNENLWPSLNLRENFSTYGASAAIASQNQSKRSSHRFRDNRRLEIEEDLGFGFLE